jgi:hypothetical protein
VGLSREQADAHIKIISEIVEGDLATKQDIKDIKTELVQLEYRLIIKLSAAMGAIVTLAIATTAAITKLL